MDEKERQCMNTAKYNEVEFAVIVHFVPVTIRGFRMSALHGVLGNI